MPILNNPNYVQITEMEGASLHNHLFEYTVSYLSPDEMKNKIRAFFSINRIHTGFTRFCSCLVVVESR
jgi:hypothetical protein